jgi:hypothetical protein
MLFISVTIVECRNKRSLGFLAGFLAGARDRPWCVLEHAKSEHDPSGALPNLVTPLICRNCIVHACV